MKFLLSHRSSRRGFTLMEMLLVLVIMTLLIAMAMYNLGDIGETAKQQRVAADLLGFKEYLAAYELQTGSLPTTEQGLKALWAKPTVEPIPKIWRAMMDKRTDDPWNRPYQYCYPGKHNPEKYDVWSLGPHGNEEIGNWEASPQVNS